MREKMTNRKLKGNAVYSNMKAQKSFWETGRNLMTFYLSMLETGISKAKIMDFDRQLITNEVAKFRQDGRDDVLDYRVDAFLKSVDIPKSRIEAYVMTRNGQALKSANLNNTEFDVVVDALVCDIAIYLLLVNKYFGYGHVRLCRILDCMEHYTGDPYKDGHDVFGIVYGDKDVIPDMSLYKRKKVRIDREQGKRIQTELEVVKMIQDGLPVT